MSKAYFVDANPIFELWNSVKKTKSAIKPLSIGAEQLQEQIKTNSKLYINSLVVSEVLSGLVFKADTEKFSKMKLLLGNIFNIVNVSRAEWEFSICVYRECVQNKVNFNKDFVCQIDACGRKFFNSSDCIHYATSRKYNLDIITNDKHFEDIRKYCDKLEFRGK